MIRRGIGALLCCIAAWSGCEPSGDPAAVGNGRAGDELHAPVLTGDTMLMRFVEHATEARVEGDLATAWRAIAGQPQRSLLPYRRQHGALAYHAVQMAFADTDLDHYATSGVDDDEQRAPHPVRRVDPVWNRTRAVYQSRQALYVPGGAVQIYRVRRPATAVRLETALGLLASAQVPARFRITIDGRPVLDEIVAIPGRWFSRTIELPPIAGAESVVRFSVEPAGEAGHEVHGFFADPILWAQGGGAPGPNVLFILLDTLRADAQPVMPRVNALAAGSAWFTQAISAATWTRPSMLSMYGGDLPTAVGQSAERMVPDEEERKRFYRIAPPLLPRILAMRGYRVSAIGNNFFLLGYPAIGLDLGFEEVDDVRHPVKDTPAITRAAIRFLEDNRARSFFLHVHYDATHWPYTPPDRYLEPAVADALLDTAASDASLRRDALWSRYLGEAAYADENVGLLLDTLDRLGIRSRTLVVVVGDHGEIFDPQHDHVVEALGFRTLHHHGWAAYDELLHVPLVISMPAAIAAVAVGAQVRLFDVAPTILDYAGGGAGLLPGRGRSLRPLIEQRETNERIAFAEGQNVRAVRSGGWAYLRRTDPRLTVHGDPVTVPEELYDLTSDPLEHDNLAERDPAALGRMRALFEREAPMAPEVPPIVYHLRAAPDARTHRIDGLVATNGRLAVRGVIGAGSEVAPVDEHRLRVHLSGPGGIDFSVEPPDAPLRFALRRDGQRVDQRRILAGEFALPLLDGDPERAIDPEHLRRLDARRAPQPSDRGDLLLWRDPGTPDEPAARAGGSATDEVTGMMERWGYANPPADRPAAASVSQSPIGLGRASGGPR